MRAMIVAGRRHPNPLPRIPVHRLEGSGNVASPGLRSTDVRHCALVTARYRPVRSLRPRKSPVSPSSYGMMKLPAHLSLSLSLSIPLRVSLSLSLSLSLSVPQSLSLSLYLSIYLSIYLSLSLSLSLCPRVQPLLRLTVTGTSGLPSNKSPLEASRRLSRCPGRVPGPASLNVKELSQWPHWPAPAAGPSRRSGRYAPPATRRWHGHGHEGTRARLRREQMHTRNGRGGRGGGANTGAAARAAAREPRGGDARSRTVALAEMRRRWQQQEELLLEEVGQR